MNASPSDSPRRGGRRPPGLLERLRRWRRGPDPALGDATVFEGRDPRTRELAARLDAAEPVALASFERAAEDPLTGRLWLVDDAGRMQGGSGLLVMSLLPPERAAALREDPTLLERARALRVPWPIDVLIGGRRAAADRAALIARLERAAPSPATPSVRHRDAVDPVTGWQWLLWRAGLPGSERTHLLRFHDDGGGAVVVGEDDRHARLATLADRLDALGTAERSAAGSARIVVDPHTGWSWSVTGATGAYGEPARRLRSATASGSPGRPSGSPR